MKQQVSPIAAVIVIVLVLAVAIGIVYMRAGHRGVAGGDKTPGMPPDVAAEFQKRMGGTTGPRPGTGPAGPVLPGQGGGGPALPGPGGGTPVLPGPGR